MRPIDADALLAEYDRVHVGPPGGARKLIEDAPTVCDWVSVKDKIPEKGNACLAVDSENRVVIARYKTGDNCSEGWYSTMVFFPPITHWMPLPEPPKERT